MILAVVNFLIAKADRNFRKFIYFHVPGERNGNPLQYSCLRNPMDRGVWWATVHGVAKSQTLLNN